MKGMIIPTDGEPYIIEIQKDEEGSTLSSLQRLVGGLIEPFNVLFGESITVYVNDEGLYTCPPNRAIYATREMEQEGYLSQLDYSHVVKEGELYTVLFGDLVAVGFDPETGADRDLTDAEASQVNDYFTKISEPGSGVAGIVAIRQGMVPRKENQEIKSATLKDEASASRAASDRLYEEQVPPTDRSKERE